MNTSKLALGTAQFGLDYGISNITGQVSIGEVKQILQLAQHSGIHTLDTAIAYGNSEQVLGANSLYDFQVVSKLPEVPDVPYVRQWVSQAISESLQRLNLAQLYGLLLHRPGQLFSLKGKQLYSALIKERQDNRVKKIGVSVYSPKELKAILASFEVDMVQIPFNVFDQRLLNSGLLHQLKQRGVEVHVRSVFLQGLLLMSDEQRTARFTAWQHLFQQFDNWISGQNLSPLEACLRAVSGVKLIDKIVVGVESQKQLQQIINIFSQTPIEIPVELGTEDEGILNPANWSCL